jgi:starch phosphorylase
MLPHSPSVISSSSTFDHVHTDARRWNETTSHHTLRAPKRVVYLSLEFLMGRSLDNAVLNLGMRNTYETATRKLGFNFEDLLGEERDAALGNGGLGRLAACYVGRCRPN